MLTLFIADISYGRGNMSKKKNANAQRPPQGGSVVPEGKETREGEPQRRRDDGGQRPGFSNVQLVFMFGVLLVVNYYGMTWFRQWRSGGEAEELSSTTSSIAYHVLRSVKVLELPSPDASFAEECSRAATPVILRNSVVEKWRARRQWTPKYLQSKITHITGVYRNDNRWFGPYYDSRKPLTRIATRTNNYSTDVTMTSKKFFKKLRNPSEGEFLYFTGDIDQLGQWALTDIHPLSELLALNPKRSSINVWMGQPHVIAHCHYDGYHNFYAQLYGTKKFTLFQPTNWPGLYPYPFLHPSHAQSQVNLSDTSDVEKFPLADQVRALEVILRPGDLLYMPPLWFHLVESLEVSISVNVWTDSEQTALMEDVFSISLPTETLTWDSIQQKTIAVSVLIHTLISDVCQRRTCRRVKNDHFLDNKSLKSLEGDFYFVYQLWTTRYRSLMEQGLIPDGVRTVSEEGILCESMSKEKSRNELERATAALEASGLHKFVKQVATSIEQLPDDTWELWTGNYVEYLATTAVDVEMVGAFLRHYGSCIIHH